MKVSILLCAYNAEAYIADAIESTLAQTFKDFEFIIVDDGSSDNTPDIIRRYEDERIKVIEREHDYIDSLNIGIRHCHGKFIARMDADDVMEPERIATQVALMDARPDITVCTTWAQSFGDVEKTIGNVFKGEIEDIGRLFLLGNFLIHSTSMICRQFLSRHRLQYKRYPYAEDFRLWTDIAHKGGRFYIIPQPLLRYRITSGQISQSHRKEQDETRLLIQQEIIEHELRKMPQPHQQRARRLYHHMLLCHQEELLTANPILRVMYQIFSNSAINVL